MLLQHHISNRKNRFTAVEGDDRLRVGIVLESKQRHRRVDRRQQDVIGAVEGNQLLQEAEQITTITVTHQNGRNVTAAGGRVTHGR